jgi:hypothetical protein
MSDPNRPLKYPRDYEGFRFICTRHEWMSNKLPCSSGDGRDRGDQQRERQ